MHNRLTTLPREILDLHLLETLHISYNRLTSLPEEISQLRELMRLDAGHNALSELPKGIGMLPVLRLLNLEDNKLQALPDSMKGLRQLRALNISNNTDIATLPRSLKYVISGLNELEYEGTRLPIHTPGIGGPLLPREIAIRWSTHGFFVSPTTSKVSAAFVCAPLECTNHKPQPGNIDEPVVQLKSRKTVPQPAVENYRAPSIHEYLMSPEERKAMYETSDETDELAYLAKQQNWTGDLVKPPEPPLIEPHSGTNSSVDSEPPIAIDTSDDSLESLYLKHFWGKDHVDMIGKINHKQALLSYRTGYEYNILVKEVYLVLIRTAEVRK